MNNQPEYWEEAKKFLSRQDKVLAGLIAQYQGETLASRGSAFFSLARAIVGQQISVHAAEAVWKRLEQAVGKVLPASIADTSDDTLRGCGLSRQKVLYLKELSAFFTHHHDYDWHSKNDAEVITALISIKGIGRWSAEMFLIFHLLRPDVFPIADLGLQNAIRRHYHKGREMPLSRMKKLSEKWKPYRTVATWYLWRSLDPVVVEY